MLKIMQTQAMSLIPVVMLTYKCGADLTVMVTLMVELNPTVNLTLTLIVPLTMMPTPM